MRKRGCRIAAMAALAATGCGTMLPNGSVYSTSPGLAAANAGVAGVLYVTAGGCKSSGCPTNMRCNVSTERCDPVKCDRTSCGPHAVCDEDTGQCVGGATAIAVPQTSSSTTTPAVPTPIAGPNAN